MEKPCLYAEINLDSVVHNMNRLRSCLDPIVKFMAVVKADAYGHGAIEVAKAAQSNGADFLGVARIEEGLRLREAGIDLPILVFAPAEKETIRTSADNNLTVTISDLDSAREISDLARTQGITIRAHLKIDTGMGRIGFHATSPDMGTGFWDFSEIDLLSIKEAVKLPNIFFEGIFTHFATSDEPDGTYTKLQLNLFLKLIKELEKEGVSFDIRHASNSAAIINHKSAHLDMVRAGIALYGLTPFSGNDGGIGLVPAMTLKTRIIHLKKIPKGCSVSYGRTWTADSERIIATIPIGYADGYSRSFSSRAFMLVRGKRVPLIGRVCMDLSMIDVTDVACVAKNDEVIVFGRQGESEVSATELADISGTINYEIVSRLTDRVKKIFIRDRF